ncbi:uncharacterized protein BDR25DRAFT_80037 [Lindgomyces ingoldianus]|uniref:Uncharacterized protein n=1 Tax=Lindgomyces ingoldianus TaxID=673940 RepID=A0ACB6QGR8_9PLEO|nr:uncharacterized protein BDR25DRAFT_80037 [Lindgomyces ingoldianus]KAF2466173.1 hypothetical protein BDR25DRAFT_80037 [Lindgomyces ingoldianus]
MGNKTLMLNPVYQKYAGLQTLPVNTPELQEDTTNPGCYTVYNGELFCRALWDRTEKQSMCGKKFSDRGAVIYHLKSFHKDYPPAPKQTGRSTHASEQTALRFYRSLFSPPQPVPNTLTVRSAREGETDGEGHVDMEDPPRDKPVAEGPGVEETEVEGNEDEGAEEPVGLERVANTLERDSLAQPSRRKRKRTLSTTANAKRTRAAHAAKDVLPPLPLYLASNAKRGQVKNEVNYKKCLHILRAKGLSTLCQKCAKGGFVQCQFGEHCQSWNQFQKRAEV